MIWYVAIFRGREVSSQYTNPKHLKANNSHRWDSLFEVVKADSQPNLRVAIQLSLSTCPKVSS